MQVHDPDEVSLCDLPLFKDIKEDLIIQQQLQKNSKSNKFPQNNKNQAQGKRNSRQINILGVGFQYIPPLSAYNATEETPYLPSTKTPSAGSFDELSMKFDQTQQKFKIIRNLGWNHFKPIGINDSLKTLRGKHVNEIQKVSDEPARVPDSGRLHGFAQPFAFQENGSDINIDDPWSEDVQHLQHGGFENNSDDIINDNFEREDQDEDDYNDSYDYDAEFARVEEEHDEEEFEQPQRLVSNRGMIGDVTIQHFVENSHIDRNPYDTNEEYENSDLNVNIDNGDSGDFTEIPWVDVSDTVQSVDSPRVTSLNSVIERSTAGGRTLRRNRRAPDNNSDQANNSIDS